MLLSASHGWSALVSAVETAPGMLKRQPPHNRHRPARSSSTQDVSSVKRSTVRLASALLSTAHAQLVWVDRRVPLAGPRVEHRSARRQEIQRHTRTQACTREQRESDPHLTPQPTTNHLPLNPPPPPSQRADPPRSCPFQRRPPTQKYQPTSPPQTHHQPTCR